jgi:phosphate transport system substrate-binding protein
MKKILVILSLFVFIASSVYAFTWPWAKKEKGTLTITGSTTVLPIAQKAAEVYMDKHSEANISVRGGGSSVGIAALLDGTVQIADASREIKTKELKAAREKGINPVGNVVAKDGIAVVVNPGNGISKITIDQIAAIYTGVISNWKDLGGTPGPIVIISRDNSSGTYEVFNALALGGGKVREDAVVLASNNAVAQTVSQTPGAIGYVGLGYLSDAVKALKVGGVIPSNTTVNSGAYKLARPLYMYTDGNPKGIAKDYLDFIWSTEGQEIVQDLGFVPLR